MRLNTLLALSLSQHSSIPSTSRITAMASLWRAATALTEKPNDYDGRLFWFKESSITRASRPRGVIPVATCLTVKGAEDILNNFELSTREETMYFIADAEKEKEDWINSIGRSIVQHSRSVTDSEIVYYDNMR
ncbi:hypothetical protein Golax_008995 [Gossypium laxum]|uniref:PH domain-containing protein n=1 Tax=Gossypium laxum TaxID=34288 RepID=A0A7J9ABM2_9ROSI|nr:hypothetical protein [Gossypium laxum]